MIAPEIANASSRSAKCRATSVCAIIVTYAPSPELISNIGVLRCQVGALVIVDNASSPAALPLLEEAITLHRCVVIRNEANLGIGAALNIGVNWAILREYLWVALFDQDSTVSENFIEEMLSEYYAHQRREHIGLVAPRYKNPETGAAADLAQLAPDGAPLEIMTSGSLIPVGMFPVCGHFREDYFIDQVDHEFSFRLRDFGYEAIVCSNTFLLHTTGHPRQHTFFGVLSFWTTHHNAERRYYMTRNSLHMVRKYWYRYPGWAWRACTSLLVIVPIKVLLAEEQKWNKLRHIALGVFDALVPRLGKRVEL